jgi:hypothetical protein
MKKSNSVSGVSTEKSKIIKKEVGEMIVECEKKPLLYLDVKLARGKQE